LDKEVLFRILKKTINDKTLLVSLQLTDPACVFATESLSNGMASFDLPNNSNNMQNNNEYNIEHDIRCALNCMHITPY